MWVTERAIQILGGYGYVREHPVERWHRDSKIYTSSRAPQQIQRLVIARAISGHAHQVAGAACRPSQCSGRRLGTRPAGEDPLRAFRPGLVVLAALALGAAACTDGSSPTAEDAATATSGATAEPSQGVTDTEVAVGVAWIDAQEILDQFGVDIGVYPVEDLFQAMAEGVNARGGVADRDFWVVASTFIPTETEEIDRVCTELLQDEEVFVVAGTLLGDQALCVTELHGQPYVGRVRGDPADPGAVGGPVLRRRDRLRSLHARIGAGDGRRR